MLRQSSELSYWKLLTCVHASLIVIKTLLALITFHL